MNLPAISAIRETATRIAPHVTRTPVVDYYGSQIARHVDASRVTLKLELMQKTGSFKARGAVNVVQQLSREQKERGITAFSAGNHAIATAYAAQAAGISAKVAMPETANPYRVERCREYGAEIVFAADIASLLQVVESLQNSEQRTLVHPFEGPATTQGTATVGLELIEQAPDLDAVIVPVGGGGLISGIASAVKQLSPNCEVFGVEPEGAAGMTQSLVNGAPLASVAVDTIADSLGAPLHMPYSFSVVQQTVDDVVTVSDMRLLECMKLMFEDLKLAVEPAAAAALAALAGPLRQRLHGKHVGLIVCGSNIDTDTHQRLLTG